MSVLFLAVFAMAIFNIKARRRPLLRICREGVEVVQVAPSSLDRIPLVPGLVRVAWLILSTQGFRRRIIRFPWRDLQEVLVSGPPMARSLTIVAYPSFLATADLPPGIFAADRVVFPEVTFASPLDEIARAVRSSANLPATPGHLPSWSEPATTA